MKTPEWDSVFVDSKMHGVLIQRMLVQRCLKYTQRRGVALDVGAHIGIWSCALAEQFERVYAFEPVCENFECLCANVPRNVSCYNVAVGAAPGTCSMVLLTGANSGCWRQVSGRENIVVTLDELSIDGVDFIKLDVEGAEGFVLEGSRRLLKQSKPLIVFEDNGLGKRHFGSSWINPKNVLLEMGYERRFRFHKDEIWTW
jgi:FkbM family methyltransferase